ncbi:hypothetical protein [Sorangium cellulosum]|uniref:hypothetical protein n=1 Tax=Sorangium cellulosum TaxID=56 RepID=UPI003B8A6733
MPNVDLDLPGVFRLLFKRQYSSGQRARRGHGPGMGAFVRLEPRGEAGLGRGPRLLRRRGPLRPPRRPESDDPGRWWLAAPPRQAGLLPRHQGRVHPRLPARARRRLPAAAHPEPERQRRLAAPRPPWPARGGLRCVEAHHPVHQRQPRADHVDRGAEPRRPHHHRLRAVCL